MHLETLIDATGITGIEDTLETCEDIWMALSSVHATIEELAVRELSHMCQHFTYNGSQGVANVPYPQDPSGATRKLHLERSSVFSIQSSVPL